LKNEGIEVTKQNISRICRTLLFHKEIKGACVNGIRKRIKKNGKKYEIKIIKRAMIYWL